MARIFSQSRSNLSATNGAAPTSFWHATEPDAVVKFLTANIAAGLTDAEATIRLGKYGPNQPTVVAGPTVLRRLIAQIAQPLVLVLVVAGTITGLLKEWVDTGVIFGVVIVNAVIGFIQEGKAAESLSALARAVTAEVTVLRDGYRRKIDSVGLVPGDVIYLTAGDKVPADVRLIKAKQLRIIEAALTGEAAPVEKHVAAMPMATQLADRINMAYAGTTVAAGQGTGVVVSTGDATEAGHIAQLIAAAPEMETPLTRKMAEFSTILLFGILVLSGLTMVVGWLRGEAMFDVFMAAVALAVGAIPEGLPAAMTITLAIGVSRMAKRHAIIRHLPAVETLGSTTVICSDKTGTLTENAMTVTRLWAGGVLFELTGHGYSPKGELHRDGMKIDIDGAAKETLIAGVLCNDAGLLHAKGSWNITGDPTEAALIVAARKAGLDEQSVSSLFPRIDELPFESARQTMATLNLIEGEPVIYAKGAVEKLLPACSHMIAQGAREIELEDYERQSINEATIEMARNGLRVLALCRRHTRAASSGKSEIHQLSERDLTESLTFLGLVGMIDPPRQRAISSVKVCHAAGIKVKMITGDHADTALAIARQLNIVGNNGLVLTGSQLAKLDDVGIASAVRNVDVFARVEPEQKLLLVRALQGNGEVVAMTGDGVNDAPALKSADIGIAMGLGGTDVAKEAAAMVLTDDNFATIEAAIEEGRGIYDNLVKFITWTLPTNFGEGLVILAAVVAGTTLPITPLQILWINMTTAVLLGLPLAFEPAESGIMRRPPRSPNAPILDRRLIARILLVGVMMLAGSFGCFMYATEHGASLPEARTIAANAFVAIEMAYLFNCRSINRSLTSIQIFSNPWVWWGVGLMSVLQLAFTYWAPLNHLFGTAPINLTAWTQIGGIALIAMSVVEIEKKWR